MDTLLFLWPALAAGLILAGIHVYLGLHVLTRGVIFVDLALAQAAALGAAVATLAGHSSQGPTAYLFSLTFAFAGGIILALTRLRQDRVPQEALIGIVYVLTAAAVVLVLDRSPEGAERVKSLLVGNIVAAGPGEVGRLAALYAAIGVLHWRFRRQFLALSLGRMPPGAVWLAWEFAFYATFAIVVTSSVRIAGVLLVFSYLVIPASVAAFVAHGIGVRLAVGWCVGAAGTVAGIGASLAWNLPTGAAIIAALGCLFVGVLAARAAIGRGGSRGLGLGRAAMFAAGVIGAGLTLGSGFLMAFPRWNHVWLNAAERAAPPVGTAFLTPSEADLRLRTLNAIKRAEAEIARLEQGLAAARLDGREMSASAYQNVRRYIIGRQEIVAGDRFVIGKLRERVRERQRFVLGLPLLVIGAWIASTAAGRLAIRRWLGVPPVIADTADEVRATSEAPGLPRV